MKKVEASTYGHVLKYTGIFGGVQGLTILLSVVRNKFAAILIGTAGIGLADLFNRTVELICNSTNFGMAFSAVRHISISYEEGNEKALAKYVRLVRVWVFATALLGVAACLVLAPLLSKLSFGNYSRTSDFCLLAPLVGILTTSGGELAILKGTRQLRSIAGISALGAVGTLVFTVPSYWFLGMRGIIPALLLSAGLILALQLHANHRRFPWRLFPLSLNFVKKGMPMVRLGLAYILAGIFGSGAEMAVRAFIVRTASLSEAGLYAAGFTLVVTYARLIFVSMDSDYFPRLSATTGNTSAANVAINRQIDVLVLLMTPFLLAFATLLPWAIRLLYSGDFAAVEPMVVCAMFYMFFKSIYSPVAYLPLARGKAIIYMCMEAAYDLVFVVLIMSMYRWQGLVGAGMALSLANLFDLLMVCTIYGRLFGFRFEKSTIVRCTLQALMLATGLAACFLSSGWPRYAVGTMAFCLSAALSWKIIKNETNLPERIRRAASSKFKSKKP